ncbi:MULTISPECIES: helix-turn-helix transcriptional regulator [Klebsiella]|uniref:helix-turn-helix transcriptional regulator n=1 Tax=Klebsiella TaxID=570 RepID=UPI001A2637E0|nr:MULTISPECIES: AlpA family phage regulatory protein [unclassified Klebsiella]MCS6029407.1 AlpA family phage regulatory protein [Klebsiella quasipneumoniae subsp. quasipneumoniae]HCD1274929.1 AlpA family phage regulatory protein [Citrobacter amalonaticus]MDK1754947.1 AlpA family phage regulatory protein [Klebsiella sp. K5-322]MDK1839850.1 AlpA family phage regulatory protein [Klebsiella sp. K5-204]HCB1239863.1 AlpA family phage regulatory protein [Klebsiella quasipneumoniae subsp. quasipneumo
MKNVQLISKIDVLKLYPVSRATLDRQVKAGIFPKPLRIGARRVAWRLEDVETHIEKLVKVSSVE